MDGVKVWFDEWVLKPGDGIDRNQSKTAKLEEGLERSRVPALRMSAQESLRFDIPIWHFKFSRA